MAVSSVNPSATLPTITQATHIDARVLAAGVAETFQSPAGAKYVLLSADGDFFCKIAVASTAATVPAADVTDGSASELNPGMRTLPGDQAYISVISVAARTVTLAYYAN